MIYSPYAGTVTTFNGKTMRLDKFLSNMGYTSRSHLSQYNGGTPVNDSLLGIKYIIDSKESDRLVNYFNKIENTFTSEKYDVNALLYNTDIRNGTTLILL